jgi:predicted MPP superfamily phosphohydrolase
MRIPLRVFFGLFLFLMLLACNDNKSDKGFLFFLWCGGRSICMPEMTLDEPLALRFVVLSDGHCDTQTGAQNSEAMLQWVQAEKSENGLDLVFFNGDTINGFNASYQLTYQTTYQTVKDNYFSRLAVPYYVIKGNHDFVDGEAFWQNIWGYLPNHSFSIGDSAFILANSSILQTPSANLSTVWQYDCSYMDNTWLNNTILSYSDKANVFILMHVAPIKVPEYEVPHCTYDCLTRDCKDIQDTIKKYSNVKALFHGHLHQYVQEKILNGKHYFWDGAFGDGFGYGIDIVPNKGYRIVEVGISGKVHTYRCNKFCNTIDQESIIE